MLDAGCGFGGKTVAYAERGAVVEGVDINPVHVEGAVAFAAARGCDAASFRVGDAEALPFPDGHFDHVVANVMLALAAGAPAARAGAA